MKKLINSAAKLLALAAMLYSCNEEATVSPITDEINLVLTSLKLQIQYPDSGSYDSAYIVFRNAGNEIKQKLILNNTNYTATGVVPLIMPGNWNISVSFFSNIVSDYESLEKSGIVNLDITTKATELIFDKTSAYVRDGNTPTKKSIVRKEFYYYQLYSAGSSAPEGFLRLPADPADPFVEIVTFNQQWIYAYVDRSFYNSSLAGPSNFYQGGGAFEIYGSYGSTYDRLANHIIDSTSLAHGISTVVNKEWNYVDALLVIDGVNYNQSIIIYHVWDLRASSNGRVSRSDATMWNRDKIEKRKRIHLPI